MSNPVTTRKLFIGKNRMLVGEIHYDENADYDELIGEGMGELYSSERGFAKSNAGMQKALGVDCCWQKIPELTPDKDVVFLDVYRHSNDLWSVSSEGTQCPFDTAQKAGVWVPDEILRTQLDGDERQGKDRGVQRMLYCRDFLELHNRITNGEVYAVKIKETSPKGVEKLLESCYGIVGYEHAEEEMKKMFADFLPTLQEETPLPLFASHQNDPEGAIIIEVRGGVVTEVFCSRNMRVEIVDFDNIDPKKDPDPYADDYLRNLAADEYRVY